MARPHVRLNTERQKDPSVPLKFNYGFGEKEEEEDDNPDPVYTSMALAFRQMMTRFVNDRQTRVAQRNPALAVPAHFEYIRIEFQSQFIISQFYTRWREDFGLLGIHISKFGHEILFAIEDRDLFTNFLGQIDRFIRKESGEDPSLTYENRVTFIKAFRLLTSGEILTPEDPAPLYNVQLIDDFYLSDRDFSGIQNALIAYFQVQGIIYRYDNRSHHMEVEGATEAQMAEIAQNFDIVLLVTSSLATVIAPSTLGQPERSYGFTVVDPADDLPIVAIVDTGISDQTPLAPLIVRDAMYDITGGESTVDDADHGTAVAALAAFGRRAYEGGYVGAKQADARLLPVKIIDGTQGYVSQAGVINLLNLVKRDYPDIKIFVLTTCFPSPKSVNADFSTYAAELDRFAHRTDSLVFVCTSNNNEASNVNRSYDLGYFQQEATNLCSPAETMNNFTVGAAAGNLPASSPFGGISTAKEYPTLYTRKGHADLSLLYSSKKLNKNYFKPDCLEYGGDLEHGPKKTYIAAGINASLQVLSANPAQSFYPQIGTSFATGLAANPALRIQRVYPALRSQTIKALLVNSASLELIALDPPHAPLLNRLAGHGLLNGDGSVFSHDNGITFVVEDQIMPEAVNIYPIHFPAYLTQVYKKVGTLRITATLCFSFDPLLTHHLAYCPVHMAFAFFRNQDGDDIQAPEKDKKSRISPTLTWSQSARFTSKPAPYTNVQKKSFTIGQELLLTEDHTLKLAVNCRVNPQLLPGLERAYRGPFAFSMAITFEENLKPSELTGTLYEEMLAVNETIAIASATGEGLAEAQA
jgi:hypothetical protein